MSNKVVRGTMLLTGATFLSKFLGMIYVIPFNELVGDTGGTLFNFAYTPYNIFLSISTVGVPLAVSKFVSKYNSLGDYHTGMRMFRSGMLLMLATGLIAFLIMFFSADWLANIIITSEDAQDVTPENVVLVIRTVSIALLVIPAMSLVRGFFQGYQSMGPTAVSQVVEQIIRIMFLLVSVFIIIKLINGSIVTAVEFATIATFVGALASCVVLWFYWIKRKDDIQDRIVQQRVKPASIKTADLFKELLSYAGPFVVVGLATSLYQIVDMVTFERAMTDIGASENTWQTAYSAFNFYGHKLVIIPGTIATGLSLAILPALTKSFTERNREVLFEQINQALQIIFVLVIPAAVGLTVLADVAYGALFGVDQLDITSTILRWYAPVALFFSLFTVTSSILQGINEQRFTVVSLGAGLLLKIVLNIFLIHTFGAKGAVFGTGLAAITAVSLNLWRIKVSLNFPYKSLFKRGALVLIFAGVMTLVILLLKWILGMFIPYHESRPAAVLMLTIGVGAGGLVYLWLGHKSTLLERTLGDRVRILDRIFK